MLKTLSLAAALLAAGCSSSAQQEPETSQPSGVKVIAHRGHWTAPESAQNSLASLRKAAEVKAYGSEFDVWLTIDNGLIVNHDRVFSGTTIDMENSTQSQISSIVLANGERIPTLREYLETSLALPDLRLVLEMKALSSAAREKKAVEMIVQTLKRYGVVERTDIISFSLHACQAFREALPDTRIYFLGGSLPPQQIKDYGLSGIDYPMESLRTNPGWIDQAHELGLEVNVWTVNSEEDMREFIGKGVDYITTDHPDLLKTLLAE